MGGGTHLQGKRFLVIIANPLVSMIDVRSHVLWVNHFGTLLQMVSAQLIVGQDTSLSSVGSSLGSSFGLISHIMFGSVLQGEATAVGAHSNHQPVLGSSELGPVVGGISLEGRVRSL